MLRKEEDKIRFKKPTKVQNGKASRTMTQLEDDRVFMKRPTIVKFGKKALRPMCRGNEIKYHHKGLSLKVMKHQFRSHGHLLSCSAFGHSLT